MLFSALSSIPLQTLIKIHISCRVRDACSVEHDRSIEDNAVLSPELDTSSHFELYSPAHDVGPLITTNDGL